MQLEIQLEFQQLQQEQLEIQLEFQQLQQEEDQQVELDQFHEGG